MRTGFGVDQLRRDAHPATAFAHRAFEDVAHAEFAPDLFHLNRTALIGEGRVTGDDEQPTDAAERGDDFFDHAVDEVLLLRSPDMFWNGNTAIDGLSGSGSAAGWTAAVPVASTPESGRNARGPISGPM